ncbi:MAG TPA: serine/threonine-protein kinase, partial [Myxococcota bacterium]|nr:serine/threonine-protein kinase [Myxococcota bacterium]
MVDTQEQPLPRPFGKYTLIRKIALGGMAEIFKARSGGAEGFEKEVVVKRILPHFSEDEAFVKMFIDEASITSKLQHPNIVQIFDFDLCEGSYYIAMELIEGVDLKKVIDVGIKSGKPLSVAQCVWILIDLSKGLHYAHVKEYKGQPLNIVHRDISPHNAMVSYNGDVKLMDFGIAKAAQRSTKTMAGTVKGKVAYMSPEQARGKPLDGRSDLFALGIMLWEMLTGKRLFLGDSDFETLTNVLKSEPPPPSQLNPKVPADLDNIILKALKKDRDERWPNVEAFQRELTRWYYSNVTDLEGESLKKYLHELFADDIRKLKELNDADAMASGGKPAAAAPAPAAKPAPAPAP